MEAISLVLISLTTSRDNTTVISTQSPPPVSNGLREQRAPAFTIDLELHSLFLLVTET